MAVMAETRRIVVGQSPPPGVESWEVGQPVTVVAEDGTEVEAVVLWTTPWFDQDRGGHVLIIAFAAKPAAGGSVGLTDWTAVVDISAQDAHELRLRRSELRWAPDAIQAAMEPLHG